MTRARDNADLGDTYGVLGSGVTGGSGLTALGTVTAGTINPTVTLKGDVVAKAWANFDGTVVSSNPGDTTIRESYNVSSVSETAQGRFTINFITNIINDDYVVAGSHNAYSSYTSWNNDGGFMAYDPLVGSFKIVVNQAGTYVDAEYISVLVFGS